MGVLSQTHGYLDAILAVFLFLMGIIVSVLTRTINESRKEQKELSRAINNLTVTISKEYISKSDADKIITELWGKIDKNATDIILVSDRVIRLER